MNRPKTYKKHVKRATDLFWNPKNGSDPGLHWQLDDSYSVINCSTVQMDHMDTMKTCYSQETPTAFPLPDFKGVPRSEWDTMETTQYRRPFLPFPDGFCADLHASEFRGPRVGTSACF
jgi:hypothetical protein